MNIDLALVILRAVVGLLLAGHGTQKLFGWFGGHGMSGHTGFMEQLRLRPATFWAYVNALAESLGGLFLALGLLTPLAAAALIGSMLVAIIKVHWSKGLWNAQGGYEFPLVLATVAFVVGLAGPGIYSLDYAWRLALPEPQTYVAALVAMILVVGAALLLSAQPAERWQRQSR